MDILFEISFNNIPSLHLICKRFYCAVLTADKSKQREVITMNEIRKRALELNSQIIADRRELHKFPEVGMDLPKTTAYITQRLKTMGYQPQPCGLSGVMATVGNGGKTILLRADTDALPMEELSGLPFASQHPGKAHTCGHDLHAAMLLGAAQILKEQEKNLKGTVKLMFQPGEEIFAGAQSMIDYGILDSPKVDAAFGAHVFALCPLGTVGYCPGDMFASVDGFRININGVGCHGASSYQGIDPINIGLHIHLALQELISREIDSRQAALLTIGQFHAGDAANIIPQTAFMEGTIRTFSNDTRSFLVNRLKEIVESVAKTFRGTASVEMISKVPTNYVDEKIMNQMLQAVNDLADENLTTALVEPLQGSEDFALIAEKVPSAYFVLGADFPGQDTVKAPHNPKVVFNEEVLSIGAAVYANCAKSWLDNNQ